MESEIQQLENELSQLKLGTLDEALLSRLAKAVDGTGLEVDELDRATEARLRRLQPSPMRDGLADRLLSVLEGRPFPNVAKVVLFPRDPAAPIDARKPRRPWWAAAAAVALAGGLSALFVGPPNESSVAAVDRPAKREGVRSAPLDPSAFIPAGFESGVSDTQDLGVMWNDSGRPMRVVMVVYFDRVEFGNEQGEAVVMKMPRVEYLLVPEEIE